MPFNRAAQALAPGPRGVSDARRWAEQTCQEVGRPELSECAQLGVSELITNALLHADPPASLRMRGTTDHPRIEVHDASRVVPDLHVAAPEDPEDLLLTFGRGLGIVARCAEAWGAHVEDDGKTMWFVPTIQPRDDGGIEGVVSGAIEEPPPARRAAPDDRVRVRLQAIPVAEYHRAENHFAELRREVRLLALAHEEAYPVARDLADFFTELDRDYRGSAAFRAARAAIESGRASFDLEMDIARSTPDRLEHLLELLSLADEFCRQERLLTLARTPVQVRFQDWFYGELMRQGRGGSATSWEDLRPVQRRRSVS